MQPKRTRRIELPSLAGIQDNEARFYLTMRLRGSQDSDQEVARARCLEHGVDYETAKQEAGRT